MGRNLATKQLKMHENTVVLNGEVVLRGGRHFLVAGEGVCFVSSVFLWAIDDLKSTVQRQIEVKAS